MRILYKKVQRITMGCGVVDFNDSEHSNYEKLNSLCCIDKVLEAFNKLVADNTVGNNVKLLDYKL